MSLIVTTPPTSEPITVEDLKQRIKLSSTADDTLLAGIITAAREFCESISRRCLTSGTCYAYFRDRFPWHDRSLQIPAPPLISVESVKYLDANYAWQTWSAAEYWVAESNVPAVIRPRNGFTYPAAIDTPGAVRVDFTAGWEDGIPAAWKESILNVAIFRYENAGESIPERLVQIPKVYVF